MSLIKRVLSLFRSPLRYVGRDLEGNRFYEHPGTTSERTKRTVQYKHPEDVWKYIGGGQRLAVQWSMWLSHTRKHPPTVQELQQDLERRRRVLTNAAAIEARDLEERKERLRIEQSLKEESTKTTQSNQLPSAPAASEPVPPGETGALSTNLTRPFTQGSSSTGDEPEAWSPRMLQRGAR